LPTLSNKIADYKLREDDVHVTISSLTLGRKSDIDGLELEYDRSRSRTVNFKSIPPYVSAGHAERTKKSCAPEVDPHDLGPFLDGRKD
jgi:hypothetical protein